MTTTLPYTATLSIIACANCGMDFGVTPEFERKRRADHGRFTCPAGHVNFYPGKSREEQLAEQLEAARSVSRRERERREHAERSAAAQKGQVTKLKNRIAAGVCPGCNRTFADLARHMAGQHPDFTAAGGTP